MYESYVLPEFIMAILNCAHAVVIHVKLVRSSRERGPVCSRMILRLSQLDASILVVPELCSSGDANHSEEQEENLYFEMK